MKIGTRSILCGYHAVWLHGWFTLYSWIRLYSWPTKWYQWVAIFFHDVGYFGLSNMDGYEGKTHPIRGAKWLTSLFNSPELFGLVVGHSRHTAKLLGIRLNRLCFADKLAFVFYPEWLLKVLFRLSGEWKEYEYLFLHGQLQKWKHYTSGDSVWKLWFMWANEGNIEFIKEHNQWKNLKPSVRNRINARLDRLS